MSRSTLEHVLDVLGYLSAEGLVFSTDSYEYPNLTREAQKVQADAVYFIQTHRQSPQVPVLYFKQLTTIASDQIRQLHTLAWNQGRVPLLVLVLPTEVRVYNAFARPGRTDAETDESALLAEISLTDDEKRSSTELGVFSRQKIESGAFWQDALKHFGPDKSDFRKHRVDRHLLTNLREVRGHLVRSGLDQRYVHHLLTRSILVLFLQHRKVITEEFFAHFGPHNSYLSALADKEVTYSVFHAVGARLNGDILHVEAEEEMAVKQRHLNTLRDFFAGTELTTGQLSFFPYDFSVIPVELISSIYEEFYQSDLAHESGKKDGTVYTPRTVVEFVLNEVLSISRGDSEPRVLDPACGSGIFLVEAYRRIVERNKVVRNVSHLSAAELMSLLKDNIYGIDTNAEAVRIAAFSLYLTMLDQLEPPEIWPTVRFPKLINSNLFVGNAFDPNLPCCSCQYDLIIGNPPWQSSLDTFAKVRAKENNWPIGDQQIAQAFLWRAGELCKETGQIAFLVSATPLLFNQNTKNQGFRSAFFKRFDVRAIVNLALIRRELFDTAIGPAALVIYSPSAIATRKPIIYVVPKTSPETTVLGKIMINPEDVKRIGRHLTDKSGLIWKVGMFGTPRDFQLIKRLREGFPNLTDIFAGKARRPREGYTEGGASSEKVHRPELGALPHLTADELLIPQSAWALTPAGIEWYHRPREGDTYRAPMVLLKHSPHKGRFYAALVTQDVLFPKSVLAIPGEFGDIPWLRFVAAFLRSKLATYLIFHTSTRWGVERSKVDKADFMRLPILPKDARLPDVFYGNDVPDLVPPLDEVIYKVFGLSPTEVQFVEDTVNYTIDLFERGQRSRALRPAVLDDVAQYAKAYSQVLSPALQLRGSGLRVQVFNTASVLHVISVTITKNPVQEIQTTQSSMELDEALRRVAMRLNTELNTATFVRRNVRIFAGDTVFIIKPNEARHWTRSVGIADADETIVDMLSRRSSNDL